MEELQSTEILDREILEDARRKAQRILKTADETAASAAASWEKKTAKALVRLRKAADQRLQQSREEIMARLPLDKRRSRLETVEGFLQKAANAYLHRLSPARMAGLLSAELVRRCGEFALEPDAAPLAVSSRGLSGADLGELLAKALPGWAWVSPDAALDLPGTFPAIRVDGPGFRVTVSADAEVEALLLERRAELTEALTGEAAFNEDTGEPYA
ncbi:MAG: ATPase [Treponema sp.]|jgi:hypothetical protein|nr:ATPase [Treponema sp.]